MDKLIEKHLKHIDGYAPTIFEHANITKEVACGFAEWLDTENHCRTFSKEKNTWQWISVNKQPDITTSELFDLYIKSL